MIKVELLKTWHEVDGETGIVIWVELRLPDGTTAKIPDARFEEWVELQGLDICDVTIEAN